MRLLAVVKNPAGMADDRELLANAVRNVCFHNAKAYLGLPLGTLG